MNTEPTGNINSQCSWNLNILNTVFFSRVNIVIVCWETIADDVLHTPNMKFINNSIDSEYLSDSITEADLEKQMAGCEVKSEMSNGHIADKIKIPESKDRELIRKSTLTNGINGKTGSPTKCNGKENGFYDEEEDFNLVLEDSSEGGDSPSKKNYDDSLSAPQIVQEIEDLLGNLKIIFKPYFCFEFKIILVTILVT